VSEVWVRSLWLLAAIAGLVLAPLALAVGLAAGLAAAIVCLLLLFGWHLVHLGQLMRWLEGPLDQPLPRGRGAWEKVFAELHRRVRIRRGEQQALAQTLARFRQAVQALPDGIIAFDGHRHIEWLNERGERYFAISAHQDRGQALFNLIRHPDFVAYVEAERFDEPLIYRGGRVPGLTLLIQVIAYGEDQNLLVARDISHIERMETMRRDFIANVSHELKTPLTVVSGFAEMLADDLGADSSDSATVPAGGPRHPVSLIREQTARMQRLIDDLLTLSALESGNAPAGDEVVELAPLLHSVVADAEALSAGQHAITLTIAAPASIAGCANELRSAFANLAANAVRYTPAGGVIAISWRVCEADEADGATDGETAGARCGEFCVTDSGIGIAAHHLPRLTERFYRVDRSRSRETGGTGLGLAIVKHVLSRHQASLAIVSEPGKGSRFTARFPGARLGDGPRPAQQIVKLTRS